MKTLKLILVGLALSALLYSCQDMFNGNKDNLSANISDLNMAKSEIIGVNTNELVTSDQQSIGMEKLGTLGMHGNKIAYGGFGGFESFKMPGSFKGHHIATCAVVTQSSAIFPKDITIDYGTGCSDGRDIKKGKIVISMSDTLINAGAVHTITYIDFYVGGRKVDGTQKITNQGKNADGQWVIEKTSNQTITHEDSTLTNRTNTEILTWVAGFDTPAKEDDEFYQAGTGSASIGDSITYKSVITTPLFIKRSCRSIVSGVIEITRGASLTVIDYGTGECDNLATVTKDGVSEQIDMTRCKLNKGNHEGELGHERRHKH